MSSTSRREAVLDLYFESTGGRENDVELFLIWVCLDMQGVLLAGVLQGSFSPELGSIYDDMTSGDSTRWYSMAL
jgi:hypothetical protein